jgi:ABC-type multidrug transport system permease subunit
MADEYSKVVVTDIKIPFRSMVILMVKWAIATIPALIILSVIGSIIFGILTSLMGGWHMRMWSM